MVLGQNHLKHAGGEPRNYGGDSIDGPRLNGDATGAPTNGHAIKPKKSLTASAAERWKSPRQSTSRQSPKSERPRLVSAYDVTLLVRSQNPIADAHDPNLGSGDLPAHHVPSFVSVASKAIQRQGHSGSYFSRQRAKLTAKRDSDAQKSTRAVPPAYWRSEGSKRFATPAASQKDFTKSSLPLLSFQNPWDSFQPPTLANVWQGLKWGLPEGYEEGGHGKYRGGGRHTSRLQQHDASLEKKLGKGWNDVEVETPNWGWTASERDTWLQGPNVERERKEEDPQEGAQPAFGKRQEWQDPRAQEPGNYARVAWLGHATTLLQLPPLADPITEKTDENVESAPGETEGGYVDKSLPARLAQQLVSQVSDVKAEDTSGGAQGKIVVRGDAKRRGQRDGLPETSDAGVDDGSDGGDDDDDEGGDDVGANHAASSASPPRLEVDNTRDRSINILFDPIFSKRCSPSQSVGPVRFTDPPCQVEDLPPIDLILLSHDHYDHSDVESLRKILERRGQAVKVLVGLGNKDWLVSSVGFKRSQVSELDWWDEAILTASGSPVQPGDQARAALRVVCTPAQHGSGRVPGGKDSTLWCSWMVETITPAKATPGGDVFSKQDRWRAFFAGDTGLRRHGEKATNRKSPVCPAFEEVAKRYGTPHLFLLPISIGSSLSYLRSKDPFPRRYSPFPRVSESLTSCIHMDAEDAVTMMEIMSGYPQRDQKDAADAEAEREKEKQGGGGQDGSGDNNNSGANAKQAPPPPPHTPLALAVHYGTFVRNKEQTKADVRNLHAACERHGIAFGRTREGRFEGSGSGGGEDAAADSAAAAAPRGQFLVANQGETVWIRI